MQRYSKTFKLHDVSHPDESKSSNVTKERWQSDIYHAVTKREKMLKLDGCQQCGRIDNHEHW